MKMNSHWALLLQFSLLRFPLASDLFNPAGYRSVFDTPLAWFVSKKTLWSSLVFMNVACTLALRKIPKI